MTPERALEDLRRDGVAVTSVKDIPGLEGDFCLLLLELAAIVGINGADLARAREASKVRHPGLKPYIYQHIPPTSNLNPQDSFVKFASKSFFKSVADGYLKSSAHLASVNIWHTFVTEGPPYTSQLWHKDYDISPVLKAFIYLSPVEFMSGPFWYALGTQPGGLWAGPKIKTGEHLSDADFADFVPMHQWLGYIGNAGTIILADTRGIHKGGYATRKERLVYNFMYTESPGKILH